VKIEKGSPAASAFAEALFHVMTGLAKKIAYDGEGMTKMITVEVLNAPTENDARICAGAIANSLLCKTAWFGCDPNWGRVLCAAGYSGAKFDPDKVALDYDDMPVVRNGQDAGTPEAALAQLMKKPEFTVRINLNSGSSDWTVWTNDISYEYVKINADYHT
jgi:glutamate N-acetyltransferase/amino-acid N-acetyltransferase